MKCLLPASGFFRNKLKIGKFRQKLTDFWSECNYRISENADISTVCWQSARGIYSKNRTLQDTQALCRFLTLRATRINNFPQLN